MSPTASQPSSATPLVIDRRLAIQLLHAAQLAAPAGIEGVVLAHDGVPQRFAEAAAPEGELWARVYSNPTAAAVPSAAQQASHALVLMISLDTKGVLALHAWQRVDGAGREVPIAIRD